MDSIGRFHVRNSALCAILVSLCVLTAAAVALPIAQAGASPRRSARVGLAPRLPARSKVVGSLARTTRLRVTVALKPRNPGALAAYASAVATPGSSVFRHYLTVAQFAARFGATSSQVKAVRTMLRADGLRPGPVRANHLSVAVTASAGQFERAFSTRFRRIRLHGGRVAFANTSAPLLGRSVTGVVQGVIGLDNLAVPQPLGLGTRRRLRGGGGSSSKPQVVTGGPQPSCTVITNNSSPGDTLHSEDQIASAYDYSPLYMSGDFAQGETIAIFELEGNFPGDIANFENCYTLNGSPLSTPVSYRQVDGGPPAPNAGQGDGFESELDIEDNIGLAPRSNIVVYQGPNTDTGVYDTYSTIVTQDIAPVISTSWGLCEGFENPSDASAENTVFQEAATQGQSIFAASGDLGSETCAPTSHNLLVQDPSSQPYVTGVGGTDLTNIGSPPATRPTESVWNDFTSSNQGTNEATTGGVSELWGMPTYQSSAPAGLNVINTNSSGTKCGASAGFCREVPDVSADAGGSTGYIINWDGTWQAVGGTSAAAPTLAAFTALADASTTCAHVPIGFANPLLYSIAGSSYSSDFNDVTVGNNNPADNGTGLYPAGAGYDMTTGLGTPVGAPLAAALCAGQTVKPIGTVALDSGSYPTGVVVDRTNNIAYIAESKSNAVAEITNATHNSFSGSATDVAAGALPGLDFPDDLALDASNHLFASNFCVGTQVSVCKTEASGTTTTLSQQTGASSGQQDVLSGCTFPSGDAVFTPSAGNAIVFDACAGSGVVAVCTPTSSGSPQCGSADTTIPLVKPGGGVTPVPSGVAAIPTTTTPAVVVADAGNSTLSVVSYISGSPAASTPTPLAAGCKPANVAIGPAVSGTATVYVACPGTGAIETGTVSGSGIPTLSSFTATSLPTTGIKTPAPYGIAVNQFGSALVVSDSANNDAVVYPFLSGTTLGTDTVVPVGTTPDGVGMDQNNAFVANEATNNVTVIDPPRTGGARGHIVASRHSNRASRAPVSLSPLIAPLPTAAQG
jgi:hypothetical protein